MNIMVAVGAETDNDHPPHSLAETGMDRYNPVLSWRDDNGQVAAA